MKEFPDISYFAGALYGIEDADKIEVISTFQLAIKNDNGKIVVNRAAYEELDKYELDIHKSEKALGFYWIGNIPDKELDLITAELNNFYPVLCRIKFTGEDEHPIKLFAQEDQKWKECKYSYRTENPEHICISELQSGGDVKKSIEFTISAYKELERNLDLIECHLQKMKNKEVEFDEDFVRKANEIGIWFRNTYETDADISSIEEANLGLLSGQLTQLTFFAMKMIKPFSKPVPRGESSQFL